ncbi:uncharacterized protein LOC144650136 isoform X3 [Oculina patagonica]
MNAKLILVAMAFAFVCISAKPREPFHYKEFAEYLRARAKNDGGPGRYLGKKEYQITKRASCHCSDDQGDYRDTQWSTGTEFWFVTCASQGWKDCDSRYGAITNCCRKS